MPITKDTALARRSLIKSSLLLSFSVAGSTLLLSPAQAHQQKIALGFLSETEAKSLSSLCELLVPGAISAGIVHYLDQQLQASAQDCLLMLPYLGFSYPFAPVYRQALAAVNQSAIALFGKNIGQASLTEQQQFITLMASDKLPEWAGPPASLWYFVWRSDAIDMVYGTPEGFKRIDMPYMAHIAPTEKWT